MTPPYSSHPSLDLSIPFCINPNTHNSPVPPLCSVFNNLRVQGKKTVLEKMGEVVDILRKGGSDSAQQLAGIFFITQLLEEEVTLERSTLRTDSTQTLR